MGSCFMRGSYSHEIITCDDECFWMIGVKYSDGGDTVVIPISLPMFGRYFDYGEIYEFDEFEENKPVVDDVMRWFALDDIANITTLNEIFTESFISRGEDDKDDDWMICMKDKLVSLLTGVESNAVKAIQDFECKQITDKIKIENTGYIIKLIRDECQYNKSCVKSLDFCLIYDHKWVWDVMTGPGHTEYDLCKSDDYFVWRVYNNFGNMDKISASLFLAIHRDNDSPEIKALKDKMRQWMYNCTQYDRPLCKEMVPATIASIDQKRPLYCMKKYYEAVVEYYKAKIKYL